MPETTPPPPPARTQGGYRLLGEVDGAPRAFHLSAGGNRVGSLPDNDVVLPVRGVSRRHAEIRVGGGGVTFRDLGSRNGVRVGGRRVESGTLAPGDRFRIGPVELELEELSTGDGRLAIELPLPARAGADAPLRPTPFLPRRDAERRRGAEAGLVFPPDHVACPSSAMASLYRQLRAVAESALPVLLRGETGVGKELLAATLHLSSPRAGGPLVTINCAAIPAELLEAELFGIGKGVATGVEGREGRFRLADGGTLFLDEVGEMPPSLQAKLLRALESGEIQPVGRSPVPVDVRVVAATNADLKRRAAAGGFREDLYYRLAGCVVEVPPLRRRPRDVAVLVEHFVRRAVERSGKAVRGVTVEALQRLAVRPWPGNVRELRHEVERLVQLCPDGGAIDSTLVESAAPESERGPAAGEADEAVRRASSLRLADHVEPLERRLIREALRRSGGNRSRAAELLGMSRNGLAYKMRNLRLDA
jgi:DNA-binding NtrC family response regulator